MRNDLVFKNSYDAHISACFDPECLHRNGYKLKKYLDGYRYYPIGIKQTYVIRSSQVVELGQYISTFYWSSGMSNSLNDSECLIIPFRYSPMKRKQL